MIKLKLEKTVPVHLNILGFIFIGIGVYNLFGLTIANSYLFIALPFLIVGLFLATAENGIIIDKEKKQFKKTVFFLGLQLGSWKSLTLFTDIAILSRNNGIQAFSRGQVATTFSNLVYEVNMLTKNHRERIILKRFKEEGSAKVFSQDIAQQLQMELNIYSPC